MEQNIITIDNNGLVAVPDGGVAMTCGELAYLFGTYSPAVKKLLRDGLRKDIVSGAPGTDKEFTRSGETIPLLYGLDAVIALAFRLETPYAYLVRQWVLQRLSASLLP